MSVAALQVADQTSDETEGTTKTRSSTAEPTRSAAEAPYLVRLDFFSGPLDLLLHLVARQEVPIEEVRMSLIAEQYLEIVSADANYEDGTGLDLEQASEYLVIAATLMAIKSRSLLPAEIAEEEDLGDWADDNPFFEDLRERLKAYKITQARARALRCTPQLGVHTFCRKDRKALQPTPEMLAEPEDVHSLGALFVAMLKRIGDSAGYTIAAQPVSVVTFMVRIVDSLGEKVRKLVGDGMVSEGRARKTSFVRLLTILAPTHKSTAEIANPHRMTVIGGFVAVLELVKRGLLTAEVEDNSFSVELAMSTDTEVSTDDFESEFDEPQKAAEYDSSEQEISENGDADQLGSDQADSDNVVHMDQYRKAG